MHPGRRSHPALFRVLQTAGTHNPKQTFALLRPSPEFSVPCAFGTSKSKVEIYAFDWEEKAAQPSEIMLRVQRVSPRIANFRKRIGSRVAIIRGEIGEPSTIGVNQISARHHSHPSLGTVWKSQAFCKKDFKPAGCAVTSSQMPNGGFTIQAFHRCSRIGPGIAA